jgi:ribosomal protein S18 acetylase RimI-like enzyme
MTADEHELNIGVMTRAEVELAVEWAAREGWNPGLADAECFHAADPQGFLIGHVGAAPAAMISAVAYGRDFGFIGFYIVDPKFRGKGLGWRLWQAGLARLAGRAIGLDGVVAEQASYAKSGFTLVHRNVRYGGTAKSDCRGIRAGIVDAASLPIEKLIDYDARHFSVERPAFLKCWLKPERRRALAVMRAGDIAGLGVIRECRQGRKIGPLFAEDAATAEQLFLALTATAPGAAVFLDVPQTNAAAVALAERHGLTPVFETARMYRGRDPGLPLSRIFGITSFELG